MFNYFVPNVTDEQMRKLESNGISVSGFIISGVVGVLIAEPDVGKFLDLFGWEILQCKRSGYEGVKWCEVVTRRNATEVIQGPRNPPPVAEAPSEVQPSPKEPNVVHGLFGLLPNLSHYVRMIEESLVPVVGRVEFSFPCGLTRVDDGIFQVKIFSSRKETPQLLIYGPRHVWDIPVDYTGLCYDASGTGFAIRDPATGFAVAELIENNLFIHYNIGRAGSENELKIFKRILEETVTELTASPEVKEERRKKYEAEEAERRRKEEEERRKQSMAAYTAMRRSWCSKEISRIKKNITIERDSVEQARAAYLERARALYVSEQTLELLSSKEADSGEAYAQEFSKLVAIPKIKDVRFDGFEMLVDTDVLYCIHPETKIRYEIGAFEIRIRPDGKVRWFNKTRRVDGVRNDMHAPHVFADGHACLGTMAEMIVDLICHYDYVSLAMVCIQFIETVNVNDDAGKYITEWPEAPVEEKKEEKKEVVTTA